MHVILLNLQTMNRTDIAIYGAGGFGREIACLLRRINEVKQTWNLIGFFDDGVKKGEAVSRYGEVLGGIDELNSWSEDLNLVIAIGIGAIRKKLSESIVNNKINFPNIIAPSVVCIDIESFNIGIGNIIAGYSIFSCDNSMGNFNTLNGSVVFGHDVSIGDFNTIMPAVRLSGNVNVGDLNFFGISSIVIQSINIGNNVRIGAGSVIMRKTKDNFLYIGNPATIVKY